MIRHFDRIATPLVALTDSQLERLLEKRRQNLQTEQRRQAHILAHAPKPETAASRVRRRLAGED